MSGTELDLTAAIEAAGEEATDWCAECINLNPVGVTLCEPCRAVTRNMLVAALPHIREQLAQQVERESGPYTSVATDEVLKRAARIVRGES